LADKQVYVFEVVETVGDKEGVPGWRLKKRCKDPCRNPVSALNNINGYVLHSNGPKVSLILEDVEYGLTEPGIHQRSGLR
jgi:hypothetical protein